MKFSERIQSAHLFLSKLFLVVLFSFGLTWLAYYLLSQIAYFSGSSIGGGEVFLLPRYMPPQNGLKTGVFRDLRALILHSSVSILIVFFYFRHLVRKPVQFKWVLFWSYISVFALSINFLGFTANGFHHLVLQVESINNGGWFVKNYLNQIPKFSETGLMNQIRYLFSVLGSNNSGYTIPGTSHPPGVFLFLLVLRSWVDLFKHPSLIWGVLVTAINSLLIVAIGLTAKICFSEKQAKRALFLLITLPSVCLHFCSMIDSVPSVFIAFGIYLCASLIQRSDQSPPLYGFWLGVLFTFTAQFSYGHSLPICAVLLAFSSLYWTRFESRRFIHFVASLLIAPIFYFLFEYWVSGGHSFYPLRAIRIVSDLKLGLETRSYPLSQIANFVVMSVMGGVFFLPSLWIAFHLTGKIRKEKQFIFRSTILVFIPLMLQSSVRLEVERIWHWAFVMPWIMMGLSCLAIEKAIRRLFPNSSYARGSTVFILGMIQLVISICLSISIQDYY